MDIICNGDVSYCAINSAVLGAGCVIRTKSGIPGLAGIAIGRSIGRVDPSPIGIKHHRASLLLATRLSAMLPWHARMVLRRQRPSLLGIDA